MIGAVSVFTRGAAHLLAENFSKVSGTGKTGLFRYRGNTGLALEKERQAFFNAVIEKIIKQ